MTKMYYDVNELEVTRAKNQLKASLLFNQDSTHRECKHKDLLAEVVEGVSQDHFGRS